MTGSIAVGFFAFLFPAAAQIASVSVQGPTATQAVLRFTAPDRGVCTVEVSESPALTPLVHDVDSILFPGSNLDSRAGSGSTGRERVFVIGKRRAEKAADAKSYSRALQAYTPHYYRVTCGAAQVTGSFYTSNIALGNTYNEELPADPNAGTAGYFVSAGQYAWPEFTNWDKNTGRGESIIDPHTGMLLKRITMPQDQPTGNNPAGDHSLVSVTDTSGVWVSPSNVLADDGASATFSGTGSNWLFIGAGSVPGFDVYSLESMVFSAKAWCSVGGCAGANAAMQACLSLNRVNCWPTNGTAAIQDMVLGTVANPSTFVTAGSQVPLMTVWTPAGYQPLNSSDVRYRSGFVNVDVSGNVTWTITGDWFNPNWTAGSHITISGNDCTIASVTNPQALAIAPASCAGLTLPATSAAWSADNFGVMVRKKTSSTDQINIQYTKYTWAASNTFVWPSSGSPKVTSDTLTQNTATGGLGYHMKTGTGGLYWIDHMTGDANYLGFSNYSGSGNAFTGADPFSNQGCDMASTSLAGTTPLAPETFGCIGQDNVTPTPNQIILSCTLTSNNVNPAGTSTSCVNLTPASTGKDLLSLIAAFTAGRLPAFDKTKFGCGASGIQNGRYILTCVRNQQDTLGWTVVFDPTRVSNAAGCVGSPNPGCVIAAEDTWSRSPARFCGSHTLFIAGNLDTAYHAGKFLNNTGHSGGGPYSSLVTSGALGATGAIAAGTGLCPASVLDKYGVAEVLACDTVTVDGPPCNTAPAAGEGNNGTCSKNNAWEGLQDAQVGDVFNAASPHNGESLLVVAKSGNSWTLARGYGNVIAPSSHTAPITLSADCTSGKFGSWSNYAWLWDFLADPLGVDTTGVSRRLVPFDWDLTAIRSNVIVGDSGPYFVGTGVNDAAPALSSPLGPAFAGVISSASFGELAQPHVSRSQNTAPLSEQKWFLDARPVTSPSPQGIDQATLVGGQLWKFTSVATDPDTLQQMGGADVPGSGGGVLHRKIQPTMAYCGSQPLTDISSSTMGDVIGPLNVDAYKYCIARKGGECRAASAAGDIYANCPAVAPRFATQIPAHAAGTFGCTISASSDPGLVNDICLFDTGAYINSVTQMGYQHTDPTGELGRSLTKGLIRYKLLDTNQNVRTLPDGSWLLFESRAVAGTIPLILAGKMPPYPPADSVNRQTFIPLVLTLRGAPRVDNAIVQFGYAENGPVDQYYCTSRREACIAASTSMPDPPFQFPSEGTDGTAAGLTGVPCATGCSVTLPALPQRIVYFQVLYRDSANRVVYTHPLQVIAAP